MTVNIYQCLETPEDEYITPTDLETEKDKKTFNIDGEVVNKFPKVVRRTDGLFFVKLECPKEYVGRMIGPKGITINNFMEISKTRIVWKEDCQIFVIDGRKLEDVILAHNLMEWTLNIFQTVKGRKIKIKSYDIEQIPEGITKRLNYGRKAFVVGYYKKIEKIFNILQLYKKRCH